jgi:hypothetical protein
MRMKMVKFEETLKDLAGALVDLANSRMMVKIFVQEIPQVLNLHPHRKGKGNETEGVGLGVCRRSGLRFREVSVRGAGGVLDQQVGQASGNVSACAFWIQASVIFAD